MTARKLTEGLSNLLCDYIQTNLPAALDTVAAGTSVPKMSIENLKNIFVFEAAQAFQCPALFVIVEDFDFQIQEQKPNYIGANVKVQIGIVVEDQEAVVLTHKAWRYQSALHTILNGATIVSSDNKLQLNCVVYRASFSPMYALKEDQNTFRKEVEMQLQVLHSEAAV